MTSQSPQIIGIALIEKQGQYLVGIREKGTDLEGKAEFPGGKCKPGEPIEDCIIRESLEETGLNVIPLEEFERCQFSYAHADVDLHFWICQLDPDSKTDSDSHFWVDVSDLPNYSFPEANGPVIEKLMARHSNS